jgi:FkbM family methyltransferase
VLTGRVARGSELMPGGAGDVYRWLGEMSPGLMLDVGAAAGWMSQDMLEASPGSRVVAFEPFPGNYRFIDEALGREARARVVKKAVSNTNRPMKFHVPSVITSGAGRWAGMEGYSSGGQLVPNRDPRASGAITVETCRLDDEISEPVRFLKIDVQGGEFGVLDGARRLFDQHGVELVIAEFIEDERVVSFLVERGYAVFDTEYHSLAPLQPFDPADWRVVGVRPASTGQGCHDMIPLNAPEEPKAYCAWIISQRRRYRSLWTDLVAIAPWSGLLKARQGDVARRS